MPQIKANSSINNNSSSPFILASELRHLLRSNTHSPETPIKDSGEDDQTDADLNGPYNFRQLLRPTEHLPTESLRKRKGILAGERPVVTNTSINLPNQLDDSPSKRRAKPVHCRKI
jgi:hypothetical protein